jgi:hypothetical protein
MYRSRKLGDQMSKKYDWKVAQSNADLGESRSKFTVILERSEATRGARRSLLNYSPNFNSNHGDGSLRNRATPMNHIKKKTKKTGALSIVNCTHCDSTLTGGKIKREKIYK